ncbi:MAG TPA: hypothetical protein VFN61_04920 [Acidimicrobiales bacterium]|nr:hypothetical protein [Acidimicrobiales bacterium]
MAMKQSRRVALLVTLAVVCVPLTSLATGGTAYGWGRPALANESGNSYFPLVAGATWTYKYVGGPEAGSIYTLHVVSAQRTAGGEAVEIQSAVGASKFMESYVIAPNGAIQVKIPSSKVTLTGDLSRYFFPSASQVTTCHPCHFTADFTTAGSGVSIKTHMVETVTSLGLKVVHVPAGAFHAEQVQLAMNLTSGATTASGTVPAYVKQATSSASTTRYSIFLVKNVGIVETGAVTAVVSVMGRSFTSQIGAAELVSYRP